MKDRSHNEAVVELFHAKPFYAVELLAQVVQADELATLERLLSVALAVKQVNSAS
ncbi:TPA: hypothetical protein ACXJQO_000351 [Serratia marcescens]